MTTLLLQATKDMLHGSITVKSVCLWASRVVPDSA
jgi:hypothetical protein